MRKRVLRRKHLSVSELKFAWGAHVQPNSPRRIRRRYFWVPGIAVVGGPHDAHACIRRGVLYQARDGGGYEGAEAPHSRGA